MKSHDIVSLALECRHGLVPSVFARDKTKDAERWMEDESVTGVIVHIRFHLRAKPV